MQPEWINRISAYMTESWKLEDEDINHWLNVFDKMDGERMMAALVDWKNSERFKPTIPGIRQKLSLVARVDAPKSELTYWESEAAREGKVRSAADKCIRYWRQIWADVCGRINTKRLHHDQADIWRKKITTSVYGDVLAMGATADCAGRWSEAVFWEPEQFRFALDDLRMSGLPLVAKSVEQAGKIMDEWTPAPVEAQAESMPY